ncbi:MAG: class I SAM-dependent methyltransferase [Thermoplasmata archaeon]
MNHPVEPSGGISLHRRSQRSYWNRRYTDDPELFGSGPSAFCRWAVARLRRAGVRRGCLVELGVGYGRDLSLWHRSGFAVRGVDLAERGIGLARASPSARARLPFEVVRGDAREFLATLSERSVDVVYSNLFYNMHFDREEHRALWAAVARVLRPGGWHLYSVRSTDDPWYGRGRRRGPATFDLRPHGSTMHFFSRKYVRDLACPWFQPVACEDHREGGAEFPIRLLYVAEARPGEPAPANSAPRDRPRRRLPR